MEKKDKLNRMYEYAVANGICKNRKTFGELLGVGERFVSKLFGKSGVVSDTMLLRVNQIIGGVFNTSWLLYDDGEMLNATQSTNKAQAPVYQNQGNGGNHVTQTAGAPVSTIDALIAEMREQREMADRQISRLLSIIENMTNNTN